jgi:hypothetical protein
VTVGDIKDRPFISTKSPYRGNDNTKPFPVDWKDYTFVFKAADPVSTIAFKTHWANKSSYGALIDNVRIVEGEWAPAERGGGQCA